MALRSPSRSAALTSCLIAALGGSSAEAADIDITRAPGVAVIMVTPRGKQPGVRATDLTGAVRAAFVNKTRLMVEPAERWGIDPQELGDCPQDTRFLCWIRASKSDPGLDFLLVASVFVVAPGEVRLTTYWFDVSRAKRVLEGGGTDTELDSAIFQTAVAPEPARLLSDQGALEQHFARFEQTVEAALPDRAKADRFGEIALVLSRGSSVEFDGRALGDLGPGPHRLRAVEPGTHRLRFRPSGSQELRTEEVTVGAAMIAPLSPNLEPTPRGTPVWFVASTLGLAAGGVALVALGAGDYRGRGCPAGDLACDPSPQRATACELDPKTCPKTSGVAFLAIGTGLLTAAVSAGLGAMIFEDEGPPWWSILVGAALGGAATAVSASAL